MWFSALTDGRTIAPVVLSSFRSISVYSRPKEAALVTERGTPCGSGMVQAYALWVWPVTMAPTAGSIRLAMSTMGPEMPSPAAPQS